MSSKSSGKSRPRSEFHPAKRSLGQNFLVNLDYIDKIIASLKLKKDETVVEIGPGRGALTRRLIKRAGKVLAIEVDRDLIPQLNREFKRDENFFLIEQDALQIDFRNLLLLQSPPPKTKLAANLPYYISTAILQHLLSSRMCFERLVVMLQREVVRRICAPPATRDRGYLSVLVQTFFSVEKLFDVPPTAFRPVPKVWSSVIRLIPKKESESGIDDEEIYRDLVSCAFRQKRKTLLNNLKNAGGELKNRIAAHGGATSFLNDSGIFPQRRAESLKLDEWRRLAESLS